MRAKFFGKRNNLPAYSIAIIGAGPRFLYTFERLAAILAQKHKTGDIKTPIEIHVYDPSGQFGSGAHDVNQPDSNWLNVIARHISRTPDETVKEAQLDRYPAVIENKRLSEFIQNNLGDAEFDPDDYPERWKLGIFFAKAINDIETALKRQGVPVTVVRHAEAVIDTLPVGKKRYIVSKDAHNKNTKQCVDYTLFVIGHQHEATLTQTDIEYTKFAKEAQEKGKNTRYIPAHTDVRKTMSFENVPIGSTIGLQGEGLDTIDKILHLTEGRGGKFERDSAGRMHYKPSGREPSKIVTFSRSNLFAYTKGRNEKGDVQYQPKFFTFEYVKALREKRFLETGSRQLDFESDIFPLIQLDMAYEFYRIKYGQNIADRFLEEAQSAPVFLTPEKVNQLREEQESSLTAKAYFLKKIVPLASLDAEYCFYKATKGAEFADAFRIASSEGREALRAQCSKSEEAFDIRSLFDPFYNKPEIYQSHASYEQAHKKLLDDDIRRGKEGNQTDPVKASTSALNDMVNNIRDLVNHHGLTPRSDRIFRSVFDPYIFRKLAPTPPVKSKEKLRALQEAGLLESAVGPHAYAKHAPDHSGFIIQSSVFKENWYHVDSLAIARIPSMEGSVKAQDLLPPFQNMMRRGNIRFYTNGALQNEHFVSYHPGTIDVDNQMHPINQKGQSDKTVTILGIPVEGARWHTNLLGRIHSESTAWTQGAETAFEIIHQYEQSCEKQKGVA